MTAATFNPMPASVLKAAVDRFQAKHGLFDRLYAAHEEKVAGLLREFINEYATPQLQQYHGGNHVGLNYAPSGFTAWSPDSLPAGLMLSRSTGAGHYVPMIWSGRDVVIEKTALNPRITLRIDTPLILDDLIETIVGIAGRFFPRGRRF